MIGIIRKIEEKGYGFIKSPDEKRDIFFHVRTLARGQKMYDLVVGDTVEFDIFTNAKGINAENVHKIV